MRNNGKHSVKKNKREKASDADWQESERKGRSGNARSREPKKKLGIGKKRKNGGNGRQSPEKEVAAQRKRGNPQIILISYCIVFLFLAMIGYLVQFMVRDSSQIINNPYNKRQELLARKIIRGDILSADGEVLATTKTRKDKTEERVYPYGRMYCHVVGRTINSATGLEQSQGFPLLTSHSNPLEQLLNELQGKKTSGDQVYTTIDHRLQKAAYDALGSYRGAVVAIEPSTGKILAMVSKPDYDLNTVEQDWERLVKDPAKESALLNRAAQGLYPPGSTFKVLTALEYMRENQSYAKYLYSCDGSDSFGGNIIRCYGGERHGTVDLKESLAHSCNGSFAHIGVGLHRDRFHNLCKKFGFNQKLPVDFEYNESKFSLNKEADTAEVAQTMIGQGKTMITPLENAMINAAIANHGKLMLPYLVDRVETVQGKVVRQYKPQQLRRVVSGKLAKKLSKLMEAVVTDGTASSLRSLPFAVAGKTGTAEYDSEGNAHAWFVGFAPAGKPKIAVSVIVEGAGTGSRYAVPIARQVLEAAASE